MSEQDNNLAFAIQGAVIRGDNEALEACALKAGTYSKLIELARHAEVDPERLEEMLQEIS